jgi:hypothetical protein
MMTEYVSFLPQAVEQVPAASHVPSQPARTTCSLHLL